MERLGTLKTVEDVDWHIREYDYIKRKLMELLAKTDEEDIMDLIKEYNKKLRLLENKRQEILELMKQKDA